MSNRPLPDWITPYIFIPWAERGNSFDGCNCYGLTRLILQQEKKLIMPEFGHIKYRGSIDKYVVSEKLAKESKRFQKIKKENVRAFDIVWMRMKGLPIHVALMIDKHRMIHIVQGAQSSVGDLRDIQWVNSPIGFYRHPDLT